MRSLVYALLFCKALGKWKSTGELEKNTRLLKVLPNTTEQSTVEASLFVDFFSFNVLSQVT